MSRPLPNRLIHMELHTDDAAGAGAFYSEACGWRPEQVETGAGPYMAVELGAGLGGGIVECATPRPLWLPYAEVEDISDATARAAALGAKVLLSPREGPAGWRSVVRTPAGGEIAFWKPKR